MIDVESRVEDLLNPCKFGESLRQQAYVQSVQSTYGPNSQIILNLNNNETVDLSNCYLEFDMSLTNQVATLPLILTFQTDPAFAAVDAGTWSVYFLGRLLFAANWNTPAATIVANINLLGRLKPFGIFAVNGVGADINVGIAIGFSSTYANYELIPSKFMSTSDVYKTAGTIYTPIIQTEAQQYQPQTPRVEKFCPLINKMSVNFNSEIVIDIPNANRLMSFIQLMDPINDKFGKSYEVTYDELGNEIDTNTSQKMKLDLSFVDLFKIILPLELFPNAQIQINLNLEDPRFCLICSTQTNSAQQSYSLTNVRLQYHKIQLTNEDRALINSRLNSPSGLIIPFKSWASFNGTVLSGQANANITFNPIRKHFLGIGVLVLGQTYYNDARNSRKISTFLRNAIDNYRLKVGNLYFPLDRVNSSNVNYSLVEPVRTLVEFCEVVKNKRITDDMELFCNFDGNYGDGITLPINLPAANDPSYTKYFPPYEENIHTTSPQAILCSDIGYSNLTSLCNRLSLQGVDTSVMPNVTLEMNSMTPTQNCDVLIFSYAQEYLQIFKTNSMRWIK